jgi:hypothetical protein
LSVCFNIIILFVQFCFGLFTMTANVLVLGDSGLSGAVHVGPLLPNTCYMFVASTRPIQLFNGFG